MDIVEMFNLFKRAGLIYHGATHARAEDLLKECPEGADKAEYLRQRMGPKPMHGAPVRE